MAKKFYAVRKGRATGVFETWDECRKQVMGFSGAEYKSFAVREDAEDFARGGERAAGNAGNATRNAATVSNTGSTAVAYVDGSFNIENGEFSYGMVILRDGKEYTFSGKMNDKELARMRNVAGEIKGAEAAMQYALDNHLSGITIFHDYEGIAKWCTGAWSATKPGTQAYRDFYTLASEKTEIHFSKVKGHSGDKYNDMADRLAKEALGIG